MLLSCVCVYFVPPLHEGVSISALYSEAVQLLKLRTVFVIQCAAQLKLCNSECKLKKSKM